MELPNEVRRRLLAFQRQEITEYHIYRNIARMIRHSENRRVLEQIAEDERRHAEDWKRYTGAPSVPDRLAVVKYMILSRLLGFTFAIKLMESGEEQAA